MVTESAGDEIEGAEEEQWRIAGRRVANDGAYDRICGKLNDSLEGEEQSESMVVASVRVVVAAAHLQLKFVRDEIVARSHQIRLVVFGFVSITVDVVRQNGD